MSHLLARLRSVLAPAVSPTPDVELLSRFLDRNDQDAFAELVRRYGPMVFGVCRRTLGDGPDADDAYQATFLVLARRAAAARAVGRVAGWLHGVATLTAKKARARRLQLRRREQCGLPPAVPARPEPNPDLAAVLDEELSAIPERYRTAVVLCELRQLTFDQAAAELGVPRGTVASRLARGREQLGKRLLRRGLCSLVSPVFSADLPAVHPTPTAHSLSREVLRTMTLSNLRWLPLAVLPLVAVAAGLLAADPPKPTAPPPKAEEKEKPKRNATVERVKLVGIGGLLEQPSIRKALDLTKEQEEKLKGVREEVLKDVKALVAGVKANAKPEDLDLSEIQRLSDQMADLGGQYDVKATKVLTDPQAYRLKQIQLQREGPAALLGRFAVRELNFTPEQEDSIGEVVGRYVRPKYMDMLQTVLTAPEEPRVAKLIQQRAALLDSLNEDALKLLTDAQRAKWKDMIGEEIPTAILVVAAADGFVMRLAVEVAK